MKIQSYSRSVDLAGGGVPGYGTGVGPGAGYQQPYPGNGNFTISSEDSRKLLDVIQELVNKKRKIRSSFVHLSCWHLHFYDKRI